jgi:hypothetical protein
MDTGFWTTVATFVQAGAMLLLGVPTLYFLIRYVRETAKLARDTATLAREAADTREAQVSPALVLSVASEANSGVVAVRNIGEHAAFDVQVQPIPSQNSDGVILSSERIPVIEKSGSISVRLVLERPGGYPLALFVARAHNEIKALSSLTVVCRSISNRWHTFRFTKARSDSTDADYFYLAEHVG